MFRDRKVLDRMRRFFRPHSPALCRLVRRLSLPRCAVTWFAASLMARVSGDSLSLSPPPLAVCTQAPGIDVSGVKASVLLNVGLLTCTLFNGAEQIVEIKIMTQVSKRKDGQLMRVMFDPLA